MWEPPVFSGIPTSNRYLNAYEYPFSRNFYWPDSQNDTYFTVGVYLFLGCAALVWLVAKALTFFTRNKVHSHYSGIILTISLKYCALLSIPGVLVYKANEECGMWHGSTKVGPSPDIDEGNYESACAALSFPFRFWFDIAFVMLVSFEMFGKAFGKDKQTFLQMVAGTLLCASRIFFALSAQFPLRGTFTTTGRETVSPKLLYLAVPGICLSLFAIMIVGVMIYRNNDFKHSAIVSSFLAGQLAFTICFILTTVTVTFTSVEATIYYFILDIFFSALCMWHNFM